MHLLGRTGVSFFAAPALLRECGCTVGRACKAFPGCLNDLPTMMPGAETALRPRLAAWLHEYPGARVLRLFIERRITHPAVAARAQAARRQRFGQAVRQ
jgi:hypothetical protein